MDLLQPLGDSSPEMLQVLVYLFFLQQVRGCGFWFGHRRPGSDMRQDSLHFINDSDRAEGPAYPYTRSRKCLADGIDKDRIFPHGRVKGDGIIMLNISISQLPVHLIVEE